jgi:heme A synthase
MQTIVYLQHSRNANNCVPSTLVGAGSTFGHLVKSISMGAQYVWFAEWNWIEEKSKHASGVLWGKNGFQISSFSHSLHGGLVKGAAAATTECTCRERERERERKECNKYDLTAVAQCFWLAHITMIGPGGLLLGVCLPQFQLWWDGVAKKYIYN